MPCHAWTCVPTTAISSGVDILEVSKLLQGLVSHELTAYLSVFNLILTQWFMAMLSEGCKPDNFEPRTNIWSLRFNSVECEFFIESKSPDILAQCETNLDDSIDSGNFSVRGYLLLIWKSSITLTPGLCSWCDRWTSFCMGIISRKLCRFLLMFLTSFTSLRVSLLFPLSITFFVIMHSF